MGAPPTLIKKFLCINTQKTLVDWSSFCREVTFNDIYENREPLGGPGKCVEVFESKFGKRKYHRGKRVDQAQWVFGGFERGSGIFFVVLVEKRDMPNLITMIKEWILPGTTIISDCWKSYNCLQDPKSFCNSIGNLQRSTDWSSTQFY